MDWIRISGLQVDTIIGVHDWERRVRQRLLLELALGLDFRAAAASDALEDTVDYQAVCDHASAVLIDGQFQLIEAAADALAASLLERFELAEVTVQLAKPGAVTGTRGLAVEVRRGRS